MNAIRINQVAEKVGLGKSTIYRMITQGRFPKPFELTSGCSAWIESDIDDWLAERAGKREVCTLDADTTRPMQDA